MSNPPPISILLVGNDARNQAAAAEQWRESAWSILAAATGQQGLEHAGASAPDIVVVRPSMPDMSTDEFCHRLRSDSKTASASLLRISSSAAPAPAPIFDPQRRSDAHLEEPVSPKELRVTIEALLRLRSTAAEATSRAARFEAQLRDADQALRQHAEDLERTVSDRTASLREAISQMEEFSYTVSHDLRAPLRSIKGYAEILLQDYGHKIKGQGGRYLERIIENGERMERLVSDVLTISRMANSNVKLEPIAVRPIIETVVREYPNLQPHAPRIHVSDIPAVIGHESLCMQVFSNLLTNAAKFVPPGTSPQIRVSARRIGPDVRIEVQDNGIGISPEFHQKIFGMFERLDPDNRYGGTGIGLAIVRRAVEKMNGRVGVESNGHSGSRFWIELPGA